MGWLTIRNWDKWQTYRKDRPQPNWIKLHRDLMRNPDWIALSDSQRGHLVSIWMLAADKNGRVPDDPKLIQRMCFLDKPPDIKLLIAHGFLDGYQAVTKAPQTVGLEESRVEESRGADAPPKRGSQVGGDWAPSENNLSLLEAKGFSAAQISAQLEVFRDHHRSKGSVFKDKDAAFRKWMANHREWSAAKGGVRQNGSGWYIRKGSAEYEAWYRHCLKVSDNKMLGNLKYANDDAEIKVPRRWP